jgi:glycerophosphoryl diester phosphodiesterase
MAIRAGLLVALCLATGARSHTQPTCPRGELPAYSHNDYRHSRPLEDALAMGYRGVEVDLVLVDGVLRVGHDRREARAGARFDEQYLSPLQDRLRHCGRLVEQAVPFLVTIDLKEDDAIALDSVHAAVTRVSRSATRDGMAAIEFVLVGWIPNQDIPAPLARHVAITSLTRPVEWSSPDVRLISVDFSKTIGRWWRTRATREAWWARIDSIGHVANRPRLRVHHVPTDTAIVARLRRAGVELIGTTRLSPSAF